MEYRELLSGTDIRGNAMENPQGKPVTLTGEAVEAITASFLLWGEGVLGRWAKSMRIAVGRDSRLTGPDLLDAVRRTLTRYGVTGLDCGLASTPSMFMATKDLPCDFAIQITASHHPYYRNGLKFFTPEGGLNAEDVAEILEGAQRGDEPEDRFTGTWEECPHMKQYAEGLREKIKAGVNAPDRDHPLQGLHIVVDAGNGVGGFYAYDVLEPLGADVSGSQFLEPDGHFPNHIPNPEDKEAMASISEAVIKSGADLGVIFDTDVDRGAVVDHTGKEISRNRLVALASAIALEDAPGGTIVTDSITSDGLKAYIEDTLGGEHHRFKRGYKNVINEALRLNKKGIDCPLAIETSGHAAMRENFFLDDGAYLVTKIIIKLAALRKEGKDLGDLLAPLQEPVEAAEYRLPIFSAGYRTCGQSLINFLELTAHNYGWHVAPDNREGLRVSFPKGEGDGWFLLRMSVHDPELVLNIESNSAGEIGKIKEKIGDFLDRHHDGITWRGL